MRSPISARASLHQLPRLGGFSPGPVAAASDTKTSSVSGKRLDIQGLRGAGILLVVVGHLFRFPEGAFAALDMFFVLSGFLITGVLLDAADKFGRIYFVPFFLSRMRRLMPTALVVIVATVASYYYLYSSVRADVVLRDGVWAAVFAANWHFSSQGTDYFSDHAESPLLHYWSLSVEEQFYAVWPLLLFGLLLLARSARRRPAVVLTAGMVVVTVVAFAYSLWHSAYNPGAAYYSTFDRVWEFGAGALLCLVRTKAAALPLWAARTFSWSGCAGLAAAAFVLREGPGFPAPLGLLPVLGSMGILLGGMRDNSTHMGFLANRPLVYIGDISYSLYLWHLPINVVLKAFFETQTTAYYLCAITLTAVFSVTSYHLLEHPLRYAPWLMTPPERKSARRRADLRSQQMQRVRWGYAGVAGVAITVCASLMVQPTQGVAAVSVLPASVVVPAAAGGLIVAEQARIAQALQVNTFPAFDPPIEELSLAQLRVVHDRVGCEDVGVDQVEHCRFGPFPAKKLAVVVGDSFASAWMPGIRAALLPEGWTVQQLTVSLCGPWTLTNYDFGGTSPVPAGICAAHHRRVEDYVLQHRPDLVILSGSSGEVSASKTLQAPGGEVGLARDGLAATLRILAPSKSRVVVLQPPPTMGNLSICKTAFRGVHGCTTNPGGQWYAARNGERTSSKLLGATYVDTVDWFCVAYVCPAFVGTTPVTVDGYHLTLERSVQLGPLLKQVLIPQS